ncbi:hypothetical protein L3Q82_020343 [Scortum barcoo]|uniref:Uncharacterized protein n=1 Tax=Scortum barcoo TaxID=214431 RepID=A0ACB8V827_9TELE|nr:hypothetical protein L3Q82_020343 [Scortum barcoo]
MILLWITLLLLHQGYALISVTTVQLGDPVTLTCLFPGWEYSNARVKWYKQSVGDTLKLITILMKSTTKPTFEKGFPPSRFDANLTTTASTLTILKTIQEDEAVYHCAGTTWSKDQWSGVYLSLIGNTCLHLTGWRLNDVILLPLCAVLAICVIVIAVLICGIKKSKCDYCNNEDAVSLQENIAKRNLERNEDTWIYSVAVFNMIKNGSSENKDSRTADRERIYAAIKAFGLD